MLLLLLLLLLLFFEAHLCDRLFESNWGSRSDQDLGPLFSQGDFVVAISPATMGASLRFANGSMCMKSVEQNASVRLRSPTFLPTPAGSFGATLSLRNVQGELFVVINRMVVVSFLSRFEGSVAVDNSILVFAFDSRIFSQRPPLDSIDSAPFVVENSTGASGGVAIEVEMVASWNNANHTEPAPLKMASLRIAFRTRGSTSDNYVFDADRVRNSIPPIQNFSWVAPRDTVLVSARYYSRHVCLASMFLANQSMTTDDAFAVLRNLQATTATTTATGTSTTATATATAAMTTMATNEASRAVSASTTSIGSESDTWIAVVAIVGGLIVVMSIGAVVVCNLRRKNNTQAPEKGELAQPSNVTAISRPANANNYASLPNSSDMAELYGHGRFED